MNRELNIDNKKKRLKLYYGLLITVLCIIGVSFAWFRLYLSQTENNTLASRTCFNTTLTEDTSKISLTDAFPITDEDGLKQTPFTFTIKNNCNSYVKVYITIDSTYRESTSSSFLKDSYMKVNISPKGTTMGKSVILGSQTLTDLENNKKGYIIVSTGLKANEEKSYDLRIWMDSAVTTEQGLNKNWAGKIVAVSNAAEEPAPAPNGWYEAGSGTLLASLRDNNELKTPLTTPGKEISAYTKDDIIETSTSSVPSETQVYYITYGTGYEASGDKFNLTGTAVTSDTYANSYSSLVGKYLAYSSLYLAGSSDAGTMKITTDLSRVYYIVSATQDSFTYKKIISKKNTTEALLASTEDDYGTSYYFRGAVKNNYIQFANKCWRIVRITGNGAIKLVLHNDNTNNASNPCSSANNNDTAAFAHYDGSTYTSEFNSSSGDNAYIGFMYGTTGSSDYASTHENINKSTILINLETWYKNNIASYESKLADTIWCNDKSTFTTYASGSTYGDSLGYGTEKTGYGGRNRIFGGGASSYASPSLICPDDNNGGKLSKFTVSDTTNGNGNLTYKIGLLTADEMAFSGSRYSFDNSSIYLQENTGGNWWWSMSPYVYIGYGAGVWYVGSGALSYDPYDGGEGTWSLKEVIFSFGIVTTDSNGLRPAISLVPSTTISDGTGTSEDPYIVN